MWLHKLRKSKKAVSNVIAVVLSLILIVVIVANVILWNYQMNQYDWERSSESVEISYVSQHSLWFTAQHEFSLPFGIRLSGNYLDTQTADGSYESFTEAATNVTYSDWFNSSWKYRKPISLNNTQNPNQLTEFQVPITFDSASLISEGKMRTDCGDLRFTDVNGSLLSYWIQSGINTENTKVWIKVPLISANSLTTIYMYYGNPSATTESNGSATFEFFDDFENLDKWNKRGPLSTTLTAENRTVVKITSNSYRPEGIYTKDFFNVTNKVIELEIKGFGGSDLDAAVYIDTSWSNNYYGSSNLNHYIGDNYAGNTHRVYVGGSSTGGSQYTHSTWTIATFIIKNSEVIGTYLDETLSRSGTPSTYVGFIALQADNDGSPSTRYYYVDWILMRKYTEPMPSVSLGQEQTCISYKIDIRGDFQADLTKYPKENIQKIEISLTIKANDSLEEFYLEAYNWENRNFTNLETFTPTNEWYTHTISLTSNLQSYIANNGSIRIRLRDRELDTIQTQMDIDFFAVRVSINGTCICLKNRGGITVHIVSIWINNATLHLHYDANFFLNPGENDVYVRTDIPMPKGSFILKVVTEKGNIAVYSS